MATGYGVDMWCTDTLRTSRLARGPILVAQAAFRRVTTPPGSIKCGGPEELAFGIDLPGLVGAMGIDSVRALPQVIKNHLLLDDRIRTVVANVSATTASNGDITLDIEISLTLHDAGQSFTFTLAVTDVEVTLLRDVQEAA